jgi:hypothetical protein
MKVGTTIILLVEPIGIKQMTDIVFLIPGNSFSPEFLSAWTATINMLNKDNIKSVARFGYSPIITEIRNDLLGYSPIGLPDYDEEIRDIFAGKFKCSKIVFIDSDIVWTPNDMKILLESDKDIICGIYPFNDKTHVSVTKDGENFLTIKDILDIKEEEFEINSGGLGFLSCSFNALDKLKFPWFELESFESLQYGKGVIGEDILFFNKLRSLGYNIYANSKIKLGHIKSNVLTISD